ncbi:MAG: hypothetical protein Fur0022_27150 [Anaerolineales bacterium]
MKPRILIVAMVLLGIGLAGIFIFAATPHAQAQQDGDHPETLLEQALALEAERNPVKTEPSIVMPSTLVVTNPLFVGVDDINIPAYRIDPATTISTTAFSGFQVWGAAYDPDNNLVYFNNGSTLYQWQVGGAITTLGTIVDSFGASQAMVSLAFYDGVLYGTKNIANEAVWIIDPTTLVATVYIDYVDADYDFGGLAIDPNTGIFYGTNDDTTPHGRGLFQINLDATATQIAPYPTGQTDIDGLAVSDDGYAYLVIDEPGDIFVYDFTANAYATPIPNPWTTSEVFSAGTWFYELDTASISIDKTVGTSPAECATTDTIEVAPGTDVYYCFEITNTGSITLTLHDLEDSQLGPLLNAFPYALVPGASAFLTATTSITQTTINTATWTAYNPGPTDVVSSTDTASVVVVIPPPVIEVNPNELSASQLADTTTTWSLVISNTGTLDLEWSIGEEAPTSLPALPITLPTGEKGNPADAVEIANPNDTPVSAPAPLSDFTIPSGVLYDNGPLVTHPGGGAGGADASALQTALSMSVYGFGHAVSSGFRVSDDFTVPSGGWTLDQVLFYAYQTGSTTTSTITSVNLRIWDGPPNAGGNIIWGDTTTNVMSGSTWSNIYRVEDITLTDANRPIMVNTVELGGLHLPAGTYWLDWQTDGTLISGPWAPPISIMGEITTGNALQFDTATWNPLLDTGTATQQGLPFQIIGVAEPPACTTLGDIPWVSVNPISGTIPGGSASSVEVTFNSTGLSAGVYTGTLCINSNDPFTSLVTVPLTLTVVPFTYGVDLSGDQAASEAPGATVSYVMTITNTGNTTDTFDLSATGVWTATVSDTSLTLGAGETSTFTVEVLIPGEALNGVLDVTTVTATSQNDATVTNSASLTTTALVPKSKGFDLYLPILLKP